MKRIKRSTRKVLLIISALLILLTTVYAYYGGFAKANIWIETQGGETLVYMDVTGTYSQAASVTNKIERSLLNDYQIESRKGFGIYYENPKKVSKEKLHSEIGCILEEADNIRLDSLKSKFKVRVFPRKDYIITEFPYKGMFSVMIGIMKVYPAMKKFSLQYEVKEDSPVMEVYDSHNKIIVYRKEIMNR